MQVKPNQIQSVEAQTQNPVNRNTSNRAGVRHLRVFPVVVMFALFFGAGLLVDGLWLAGKAKLAQILLSKAWSRTLKDGQEHKPWPWADHWPAARLVSKAHGIDQIVLAGDNGAVLAFAPGMNMQAAQPGKVGTVIISGHRDTHFRFMQDLKQGTEIEIETRQRTFRYRVHKTQVVDSKTTEIDPVSSNGQILLITCYPFDTLEAGGTLRYVAFADLIH
jgi:sortase A